MTLNIIPPTMRARHIDTGEWHVLRLAPDGYLGWGMPPDTCYVDDSPDGGFGVDLTDFDSFEVA